MSAFPEDEILRVPPAVVIVPGISIGSFPSRMSSRERTRSVLKRLDADGGSLIGNPGYFDSPRYARAMGDVHGMKRRTPQITDFPLADAIPRQIKKFAIKATK